LEQITIKK